MFKYSLKQLRVYYLGYVGTIITLIATATLGMVSCELLGSSIIDLVNNGSNDSTTTAISMFGSVCGFLIFLVISSLVMAANYSLKRRWKSFSNLRILGTTYRDIRKMILIETFILSLISLIIGIPIGIEISYPIFDKFKEVTNISNSIQIGWNYILILITIGIFIFIVLLTTWFISKKLKKITIDQVKDINNLESKFVIIFKVFLGIAMIATPLIIFNLVNLEGGWGQIYMTIGLFVPVIGFALSGKYIFSFIVLIFKKLFSHIPKISFFLAGLNYSLSKIVNIVTSIAFIIVFQGILVTTTKTLADSKEFVANKLYSGLYTYQVDKTSDLSSVSTSDVSIIYNLDAKVIHNIKNNNKEWKDLKIEMVKGKIPYNLNPDISDITLSKDQTIITTDYRETKAESSLPIKINEIEYNLKIEKTIKAPLERAQFTSIYIGFDSTIANQVSASKIIVISNKELNNPFLKKYDPLLYFNKTNNAASAVTNLIQSMVIVFSIINILNFVLLFIYDRRHENKLKNTLGANPKILNISLLSQTGIVASVGVLVGIYSTLTFTIPYVNSNPINSPVISSPIIFSIICISIIIGTMIFAYIISKLTTKK